MEPLAPPPPAQPPFFFTYPDSTRFFTYVCVFMPLPFLFFLLLRLYSSRLHVVVRPPTGRPEAAEGPKVRLAGGGLDGGGATTADVELSVCERKRHLELEQPSQKDIAEDGPKELLGVSVALLHDAIVNAKGDAGALALIHTELHQSNQFLRHCFKGGGKRGKIAIISCALRSPCPSLNARSPCAALTCALRASLDAQIGSSGLLRTSSLSTRALFSLPSMQLGATTSTFCGWTAGPTAGSRRGQSTITITSARRCPR